MRNLNTKKTITIAGKSRNIMIGGNRKFYYTKKNGNKFEKIRLTKKQIAGFANNMLSELERDLNEFVINKKFIENGTVSEYGAQPLDEEDFNDIKYFTFSNATTVYKQVQKYMSDNNKIILGYKIFQETDSQSVLTIEFIPNTSSPASSMSSPTDSWQDAQDPYSLRPDEEAMFSTDRFVRPVSKTPLTKQQITQKINNLNDSQMLVLEDCLNRLSIEAVGTKRRR